MIYKLRKFQKEAKGRLMNKVDSLLKEPRLINNKIIFESPTGSGKTIILSKFIEEFLFSHEGFAFVWLTPGKGSLHIQSQKKIEDVLNYSSSPLEVLSFDDALKKPFFPHNSITVLNWEKITKKSNVLHRSNERFDLSNFLSQSKKNVQLIAIVDEEHFAKTYKTIKVLEGFNPKIIIRASATPKYQANNLENNIKIHRNEVIDAELIKKKYILNHEFNEDKIFNAGTNLGENKLLLETALKTRKKLLNLYQKNESKVNPLIIIQLPDEKGKYETEIKTSTEKFLFNNQINYDNGLLAIDLDKMKRNLKHLKEMNNKAICVITKQTITHGWDCPRAQILVKLRGNSGKTFNIQTLGRISRVPEIEKGYYSDDALNSGYVFTFDKSILEKRDSNSGAALVTKEFHLKMKNKWSPELLNTKLPNQSQKIFKNSEPENHIEFAKQFNKWFRDKENLQNIPVNHPKIKKMLLDYSDFKPEAKFTIETGTISGDWYKKNTMEKNITISYKKNNATLEKKFHNWFCHIVAKKLKNKDWKTIKYIIEYLFSYNYENGLDKDKKALDCTQYIYNFDIWNNRENKNGDDTNDNSWNKKELNEAIFFCFFINTTRKWVELFEEFYKWTNKEKLVREREILHQNYLEDFVLEKEKTYNFAIPEMEVKKLNWEKMPPNNHNLYKDFVYPDARNFSQPERDFIWQFLEANSYANIIDWWYRNTVNESNSWKILYLTQTSELRNFYPDFIVSIKNKIWIIEIKDDSKLDQNNSEKFWYLRKFCNAYNLNFAFVIVNKNKTIKFNNSEWDDESNTDNWKNATTFFNVK